MRLRLNLEDQTTQVGGLFVERTMTKSEAGKLGALAKWGENHVKSVTDPEKKRQDSRKYYLSLKEKHPNYWEGQHNAPYSQRYPNGPTDKRRFSNMRYKVRKVGASGSHSFEEWENLKEEYHFLCLACGKQEPEIKLTEDHKIPLSMGGSDFIDNIQPLCGPCNTRKHAKALSFLPLPSWQNWAERSVN